MNESQHIPGFYVKELHTVLESVVGKIGMRKTVELLKSFESNSSIDLEAKKRVKLIQDFIITNCITIFNLDEQQFYTSEIREYREARMACFHVLHRYTDCSYAMIGELFGRKKRTVLYFCQKCRELLSVPGFYRGFVDKYKQLDQCALEFIGKLN